MDYEICCKTCGAKFATIRLVSTRSFMNSCHAITHAIPVWNEEVEFIERDDRWPLYRLKCYNCGQLHMIYKKQGKFERRRVNK